MNLEKKSSSIRKIACLTNVAITACLLLLAIRNIFSIALTEENISIEAALSLNKISLICLLA